MFASVVLCDFQKASHVGCSSPGRVLKALGPREAAQLELHVTLLCMVEQPQSVAYSLMVFVFVQCRYKLCALHGKNPNYCLNVV